MTTVRKRPMDTRIGPRDPRTAGQANPLGRTAIRRPWSLQLGALAGVEAAG
jgi:hypothetical protein